MLKPILRTLPTLSGNVKIACNVTEYLKSDTENVYECFVRYARLLPISSVLYQKYTNISLLNSSYEFDLKQFYQTYSQYFYEPVFTYNKKDLVKYNSSAVVKNRNIDFEFGCKRISYLKNDAQYAFFAPIWVESVNDMPDYFLITCELRNNFYSTTRYIKVNIKDQSDYKYNYLYKYLNKYMSRMDNKAIACTSLNNQATYYGIDVIYGGFNKCVDNMFGKIYNKQMSINGFDAHITNGFKRNHLVMKQIIPLSFYFNINDVFDTEELNKFANTNIYIKGNYYKDGKEVKYYDFSHDYKFFEQSVLKLNQDLGFIDYCNTGTNIMDVGYPSINEAEYVKYDFSNKLTAMYTRWKLKYSSDENPYITNASFAFSKNQNSMYKYGQFPIYYTSTNILCDEGNNIVLPFGESVTSPNGPYYNMTPTVNRYKKVINNYASTFYTLVDGFNNIFDNESDWVDVVDKKAYYKGILYDFSSLYAVYPKLKQLDKFAVFANVNFIKYDYETLCNMLTSKYTLRFNKKYINAPNCVVNGGLINSFSADVSKTSYMYMNEASNTNMTNQLTVNNVFLPADEGTDGDFINLQDYGFDYYSANRYFKVEDMLQTLNSKVGFGHNIDFVLTNYIDNIAAKYFIDGYERLPIGKLNNVYNSKDEFVFSNNENGKWLTNSLYVSQQGNSKKLKYKDHELLDELYKKNKDNVDSVSLYYNTQFLSYESFKEIMTETIGKEYISYSAYLTNYIFEPETFTDNGKSCSTVSFSKLDDAIGRYYGSSIPFYANNIDNDVLYVDSYNMNNLIARYNDKHLVGSEIKYSLFTEDDTQTIEEYSLIINSIPAEDREKVDEKLLDMGKFCTNAAYRYFMYSAVAGDGFVQPIKAKREYDILTDYNSRVFYARFLNNQHVNWYFKTLYNNYNMSLKRELGIFDVFIRQRFLINDYLTSNVLLKDNYIPLSSILGINQKRFVDDKLIVLYSDNVNEDDLNDILIFEEQPGEDPDDQEEITIKGSPLYNLMYSDYWYTRYTSRANLLEGYDNIYKLSTIANDSFVIYKVEVKPGKLHKVYVIEKNLLSAIFEEELTNKYSKMIAYNADKNYWTFNGVLCEEYKNRKYQDSSLSNIDLSEFKFELFYKKRFIKVNENIYNIINIEGKQELPYKDLYLYRLYKQNEIQDIFEEQYSEDLTKLVNAKDTNDALIPLFTDIFLESKDIALVYKEYFQDKLSPTTYLYGPGMYCSFDKEDVERVTGQPAKEYMCPYKVKGHSFWYSYVYDYDFIKGDTGLYYRYDSPEITMMYDISEAGFDTKPFEVKHGKYTTKYATNSFLSYLTSENVDTSSYSVLSTYNMINNINSELVCTNNELGVYGSTFKLNTYSVPSAYAYTYTYFADVTRLISSPSKSFLSYYVTTNEEFEGTSYGYTYSTYGFFNIDITIDNTSSSFDLINTEGKVKKFFTYINNNDIYEDDYSILDTFNVILPAVKTCPIQALTINNLLYTKPKTFTVDSIYKSGNLYDENGEYYGKDIAIIEKPETRITFERYFDDITPLITEASTIYNSYVMKYKEMDAFANITYTNNILYNTKLNINNVEPLRIYDYFDNYSTVLQPEYKHFNDNKFVNLETEFTIKLSKQMTYEQLLEAESKEYTIEVFKKHINYRGKNTFDDDTILFLFNKYKVEYDSSCIGLNVERTEKLYTLQYKFILL